jgi:hypothetical protein
MWNLGGVISNVDKNDQFNLAEYGFGDVHSAEWVFPIQKTNNFWRDMAKSLKLKIRRNE